MLSSVLHDATPFAWLVVAAYFAGGLAAFVAGRSAGKRRERNFWFLMAALLVALGLNKQLDLQTYVTRFGRFLARSEGWYDYRREVQAAFIALVAFGSVVFVATLLNWTRRSPWTIRIAATGSILLGAFIVIRAASFHHIDKWVTVSIEGLRSGWWLELAGIAVIACAAALYRSRR